MKKVLDKMESIFDYYFEELENINFRCEIEEILECYYGEMQNLINKSSINNEDKKKLENLMGDNIMLLKEHGMCKLI